MLHEKVMALNTFYCKFIRFMQCFKAFIFIARIHSNYLFLRQLMYILSRDV